MIERFSSGHCLMNAYTPMKYEMSHFIPILCGQQEVKSEEQACAIAEGFFIHAASSSC